MQDINQFDLILISDSGKPFLVKMKEVGDGHEPASVEPLDTVFEDVPLLLRDVGTTFAIMPDAPNPQSGVTCVLLNMQSIKGSLKISADPNREAPGLPPGRSSTPEPGAAKPESLEAT